MQELRASRLVPLLTKGGDIKTIVNGEVWAHLMSMCAMAACPGVRKSCSKHGAGTGFFRWLDLEWYLYMCMQTENASFLLNTM
jgi:hypothetical protein